MTATAPAPDAVLQRQDAILRVAALSLAKVDITGPDADPMPR